MNHTDADDLICELLARSDFHTAFAVLHMAFNHLNQDRMEKAFGLSTGQERFHAYLDTARQRHGELTDIVLPVFEEIQRQSHLVNRRGQITSSEHRFFLALLLNVPDRAKVLDLVRQRFPDREPLDTVTDWVDELANTKVWGSAEQNVLGINDFDDGYLFAFRCLMENDSTEEIRERFEKEFSIEYEKEAGNISETICEAIRNSFLFRSLFSD